MPLYRCKYDGGDDDSDLHDVKAHADETIGMQECDLTGSRCGIWQHIMIERGRAEKDGVAGGHPAVISWVEKLK